MLLMEIYPLGPALWTFKVPYGDLTLEPWCTASFRVRVICIPGGQKKGRKVNLNIGASTEYFLMKLGMCVHNICTFYVSKL